MNILVLNQDWFVEDWRAAGHTVYSFGLAAHLDVVLPAPHIHIDNAIKLCKEPFQPDIIVIHDNSGPIVLAGLEETDIPVIFYSVDTHHHHASHKYLAHIYDHTFVAQKDYIYHFHAVGSDAEWLPLWASRYMDSSTDKQYEAVFVGNLNPDLNPQRVWFFNEINKITKVKTHVGKYWEIFPFAEIVLNQTVKGDLNFRVFEAMMSGAMLLTEEAENGLPELFENKVHLATYLPGNPDDAAEKVNYYLANKKLAAEIGSAGREEILKKHLSIHRAQKISERFKTINKKNGSQKFFSAAAGYCELAFLAEKIDTSVSVKGYVSAMKCITEAINRKEPIDTQLACYVVCSALKYDQFLNSGAGKEIIFRIREAYPNDAVLRIAVLRQHLNQGKYQVAREMASLISQAPAEETFTRSEELVQMILKGQSFCL